MKYAVEMSSGAMIYIPSFIEIGSVDGGVGDAQTHRQQGDVISLFLFFKTRKVS
jgi:hypothetical protein